ncbi:MAG: DinB family protein [Pyrinomonadaceae bacterium]
MKALELLADLSRHTEWADATVWRAVLSSPAATTDQRIRDWLHHIHMVQHAFINVWRGQEHSANAGSELGLVELANWGREYHQLAAEHLAALNEDDLDQPMNMPWAKFLTKHLGRDPSGTTRGETIMQVASHSTYHRGQVNARLRELGEEPPLTDFIAWIWFGKPAAEWPTNP